MPAVTYKDRRTGKTKKLKTSYTKAGKKKAKVLAKRLGGEVVYAKKGPRPPKKKRR